MLFDEPRSLFFLSFFIAFLMFFFLRQSSSSLSKSVIHLKLFSSNHIVYLLFFSFLLILSALSFAVFFVGCCT